MAAGSCIQYPLRIEAVDWAQLPTIRIRHGRGLRNRTTGGSG
jgi:hypothetical protein